MGNGSLKNGPLCAIPQAEGLTLAFGAVNNPFKDQEVATMILVKFLSCLFDFSGRINLRLTKLFYEYMYFL